MANRATRQIPPHTPEVFEILKQCATDGDTIDYRNLAGRIGGVNLSSVFPTLDYIRDDVCLPCDLPWLWVLAVNGRTERPGAGAWTNTGITKPRDELHWSTILHAVYAYPDWSDVKIEDPCPDQRSDVPRSRA